MGRLNGSGLLPVPADQIETAAALGIGTIGDDSEVAHPVAVAQQFALVRTDADRKIAGRRNRILFPEAVARQVVDLGSLADRIGLVPIDFPVVLGQRGDAFGRVSGILCKVEP
jgi:hypothetical protein